MKTTDLVRTAVANTFRSRLRTTLTVLALFVGAFTLTLTTALGECADHRKPARHRDHDHRRHHGGVLNAFAIVALIAAAFGIVNTLLMSVQERTREIGLMKAMGMGSARIFTLFSLEAVAIGIIGSVLGVGTAMLAGAGLSSALSAGLLADLEGLTLFLFEPLSLLGVVALISTIAFVSGALPASRAARQRPIESLRYE